MPVAEVKIGPEITGKDLLFKAAAMAMRDAGREGISLDYEQAIKQASKIYGIPYQPSELPKLLAQRAEIDRQLALLKQGKQVVKARRQAKLAPTPAGAEEYWRTHALPTDRIKPATKTLEETEAELAEDLKKWFKEKWVRFGPDGKIRGDCARGSSKEGKPKCLPQSKAHALGKKGRASAAAKKRREDPNAERRGPARNVATKVRENTAMQDPNYAAGMAAKKAGGGATDIMLAQPDIAKNQQYLDKIAAAYGLPAGLSAEQIKAKYQAASQQRAIDDIARKQGLPAGMTKDQFMQAWRKKVQGQTQSVTEGAQSESEQHHGWRAELVDEITPTTFEVQVTNKRSRESANFVVRPVDMIRPGLAGKFSIDSMDIKDLQTGATRSIQSDSDEPWVYILDAVSALFWDTPALQARLQAQLKAHQDQGLPMLPGLTQRRSAGQSMPVKDFVKGQQVAKDAISKAQSKKGMAEGNNDDWYDDADEFGMPGSEFFPDDDRLRDGDYVRDRQDGESGEIFRMSGDPTERRVRILDRDGKGWYISPERLVAVDRNDPDIMKYFGKKRRQDIDEKQDACYRKVKSRYKVWPSAYASGALVQCRKKGAANWGTGGKKK